ncbi:hypothetical protein [Croceicoccus sp. BE223]|uniref:hypothetical protein n=1 Tax=Croceicoccus sp. BE223 TaxID=2817716 RepID=UPI0028551D1E|nr:hypothetical protein [Croceicoccus sp. BE223]MDR7101444.1 hypothetical protein [Croceicoccus sp. BE223]
MTKRREPITFHRALTIVAAHIGWDRCAAICGVTERAVRNWSDPDTDAEIRLIDARRLDQAYLEHGGAEPPFMQVYKLQLELAALSATERSKCLGLAASNAAKEGGEAFAALMRAALPGAGAADRRRAEREAEEAIAALHEGLSILRNETGKADLG